MRLRSVLLLLVLLLVPAWAQAQATHITTSGTLPAACRVGDLYQKTGTSAGLYTCTATDTWEAVGGGASTYTDTFGITIDGGGAEITTGTKGFLQIPVDCTITSWTLLSTDASATSGSIVIDVKKSSYAGFPTTTSIAASAKPTLTAANKATDSTLTGWTTSLTAGDILEWKVDSASTVTRVTLMLTASVP